ncbi:hypothetical protein J3459_022262 [Metarhizium acridum]|nr:hypothetical protein J3459_022262 [Metarhizium acridum]
MGDQHAAAASHYAILIGIDAYPAGPLTSCVRDVQMIRKCLEDKLSSVDMQILTASKSPDPEMAMPLEDPECWPSIRNVTLAFERITSQAKSGDFVYIHYSGHGTRLPPCWDFSNKSTGDLALVLLEEDQSSPPCLRGPQLARLLKNMIDKELVITLVLDCCFSAAVYRKSDCSVRYLPCGLEAASTPSPCPEDGLTGSDTRSTNRAASMHDNWLLEPDRYTILAACGPHEKATTGSEASAKGVKYGALSYFLCQTLSDHGLGRRHKHIHRHLCARFRESCVAQHPVLYGNADQGFFGQVSLLCGERSICIMEHEGSLQLLAGQAHGLRNGDRFTVYRPGGHRRAEDRFIAKVVRAGALTSQLELLATRRNVQTGWVAEPLACAYFADFPIRLAAHLPRHDELLAALKERSLSTNMDNHQVPALQVVLGNTDEYEILDDSGRKLINVPAMPRDQTDIRRVCDVLQHLARFRIAKDLVNPTPTAAFRTSFDVHIIRDSTAFGPGEQIEVRHNSSVKVAIKNKGDAVLYAYLYSLGPCWGVKGILRATYQAIPPRTDPLNGDVAFTGMASWSIRMMVRPLMREHGSCEDIIKVLVTSQPTSFDLLELSNLDELAKMVSGSRLSHPNSHVPEDWIALNFPIRTSL